jgi:hypothetical protein
MDTELVKLEDRWKLYWHLDWQDPAARPQQECIGNGPRRSLHPGLRSRGLFLVRTVERSGGFPLLAVFPSLKTAHH